MRSPFWTLVVLVVISNVYRHIVNADSHELGLRWFLLIGQLPAYLDLFGFGSFAAYIIVHSRSKPQPQSRFGTNVWTIVACLSGVMFYIFLSTIEHTASSLLWLTQTRSLLGLTFLSLCVGIDRGASPLRHVLENPVLLWFSYVSYNLYLWNDNILEWYRNNVPSVFSSIPDGDTLNAFFIMSIPICIAWAVTHWIETPLLRTGVFAYIARLRARETPA
jgi:peptidoglycan/LPS O-acetylase OafA/YrhL